MKENARIKEKGRMGNLSPHDHHPHQHRPHRLGEDSHGNSKIPRTLPTEAPNNHQN